MANRTADLPPLPGLPGFIRELRHQEAMRQGLGLALMPIFAWVSTPVPALFVAGAALVALGCLVRIYASGYIVKNKALATDGPYSLVRHPLYTGNLLVLVGFTLACGQWWAPIISILFWWFYYPTAISYEDRKLHRIFGDAWEQWSHTVPAVIPRRLLPTGPASWSLLTSVRQNAEPIVIVFTLLCLGWIGAKV
ncbi:MAG: isoprenylcysteine carboxylmethyltransferase family protein [Gammaproteobacteria bacterium]